MKYRPEIDGLRFLAVFIVIIYHIRLNLFDINIFQGGFIGVDVFFVISGYLITSIILEDVNKNQFDLFNFFERRIRRIIPLLTFISLFFLIIAVIILRGQSLIDLANTVLSSIFFYSNFFFIFKEVEYGVDTNSINPFLHTWSLSIEEQYYILFPLFIILIKKKYKFFKDINPNFFYYEFGALHSGIPKLSKCKLFLI
jgi:peptidoglycan/LPS O-acetylase OafA/YrhL